MKSADLKIQIVQLLDRLPSKQLQDLFKLLQNWASDKSTPLSKPQRKFGSLKGLVVHMADDFDEPLDDFKEYMI